VDRARESKKEVINYTVLLYNVTDDKIRGNKVRIMPPEQRFDFPIKRDATIKVKNLLFTLRPAPVIFADDNIVGGSLY